MRGVGLLVMVLATSSAVQANDIVDFLNALNGNSGRRGGAVNTQPVRQYHDHGHEAASARGNGRMSAHADHGHEQPVINRGTGRAPTGNVNLRPNHVVNPPSRSRLQVNLQFASNAGANQGYGQPLYIPAQPQVVQPSMQQLPPVDSYPTMGSRVPAAPAPFQLGEFVDCRVPLATCVRVEDVRNIAPNAVPVVVAVRDPGMCIHDVQERLVYVQVFVPTCPLMDIRVSPCRTRISLDYGHHMVHIKSANGLIVVDYDN